MPRQARVYYPGGVFHIISRCVGKEFLLEGAQERRYYLGLLAAVQKTHDARVLAWCIMSNHVHLVLRAGDAPLGRFMKAVHSGYAGWKNRRDGRIGPLFAERYKTILVEEETHLLELVRYVHLNPVRALIADHPDANDWSSHRFYAGLTPSPAWLDTSTVLSQFDDDPTEARRRYQAFIDDGLVSERSLVLSGHETQRVVREIASTLGDLNRPSGAIVGSEDFIEEVLSKTNKTTERVVAKKTAPSRGAPPPIESLIDAICAVLGVEPEAFIESRNARRPALARRILTRIWVREYGEKQATLARHLHVASSIVSRWHTRAVSEALSHGDVYERVVAALARLETRTRLETGEHQRRVRRETRTTVNIELVDEASVLRPEE